MDLNLSPKIKLSMSDITHIGISVMAVTNGSSRLVAEYQARCTVVDVSSNDRFCHPTTLSLPFILLVQCFLRCMLSPASG